MNWQPIETFPLPEFVAKDWHKPGPRVLLWINRYAIIGSYGYTQRGKGRWQEYGRTCVPTHWMPLPSAPDTSAVVQP